MSEFMVTIRCLNAECGHKYKRKMAAADETELAYIPDPPCPKCSKPKKTNVAEFKFDGRAPAIGGSLAVRAVDTTAQIVMEDHKMTDLRSDVREGESMAPKLPPRQQAMADSFFAKPNRNRGGAGIFGLPPAAVLKAAVGGRFNTPDTVNPIAIQHKKKDSAPIHYVAGDGVNFRRG